MKLSSSDLNSLVFYFLKNSGYDKIAKRFKKAANQEFDQEDPFNKVGLLAIIKSYVKNNSDVRKAVKAWKKNRKVSNGAAESEEDEVVIKPAKKNKKILGKRKASKEESEDENEEEEEKEIIKPPKAKKQKVEQIKQSKELVEEVNEENDEEEASDLNNDDNSAYTNDANYNTSQRNKTFSRIKEDSGKNLTSELKDNTFEAKFKYGQGGDAWGVASNGRLSDKKGKNFRKEKTKMKGKNFHGAGARIEYKVNSIRL